VPLAFRSQSHGTVAFGFFQIESDMLLLERRYFFADRFCRAVVELAEDGSSAPRTTIPGWRIDDPAAIGDLGGAIRGEDLGGFIGATYERFPFPAAPEDFKQSPDGALDQALAAELIAPFAKEEDAELTWDREARLLTVAEFAFDEREFARLVAYVDRGGYPRWRDGIRPDYVRAMTARLDALGSPLGHTSRADP
jgi:hypothetical protein